MMEITVHLIIQNPKVLRTSFSTYCFLPKVGYRCIRRAGLKFSSIMEWLFLEGGCEGLAIIISTPQKVASTECAAVMAISL